MDARMDSLDKFAETGKALIKQEHFMSEEISEKISVLESKRKMLFDYWETRRSIYQQNLDLRVIKYFKLFLNDN